MKEIKVKRLQGGSDLSELIRGKDIVEVQPNGKYVMGPRRLALYEGDTFQISTQCAGFKITYRKGTAFFIRLDESDIIRSYRQRKNCSFEIRNGRFIFGDSASKLDYTIANAEYEEKRKALGEAGLW